MLGVFFFFLALLILILAFILLWIIWNSSDIGDKVTWSPNLISEPFDVINLAISPNPNCDDWVGRKIEKKDWYYNSIVLYNNKGEEKMFIHKVNSTTHYYDDTPCEYLGDYYQGYEDPRLVHFKSKTYLLYTILLHDNNCYQKMYLKDLQTFKEIKINYDTGNRREKNWTPLITDDKFYLVYSISPETILLDIDPETGEVLNTLKYKFDYQVPYTFHQGSYYLPDPFLPKTYFTLIHYRIRGRYYHALARFTFERGIIQISHPFRFPGYDDIQFGIGLKIKDSVLYVSYGKEDSYSLIGAYSMSKIEEIWKLPCLVTN